MKLNIDSFNEIINTEDKLVLVDIYASWCGPCKMLEPILQEIAYEYEDSLSLVKVDGDYSVDVLKEYNVMGFPTLLIFKNGQLLDTLVGARGKGRLIQELEPHLK